MSLFIRPRVLEFGLVLAGACLLGALARYLPPEALIAGAGLALLFALPPYLFIGASVAVLCTYQQFAQSPISLGSVNLFTTDVIVAAIALRAVLPYARKPAEGRFSDGERAAVAAWLVVMSIAAVRGYEAGTPLDTVFRLGMSAIYFPLLYVGFSHVIREERMESRRLGQTLAVVILGFIAWMVVMRVTGRPFETANQLGRVETSGGDILRRDYGSASAFVLYPLLAIGAAALVLRTDRSPPWVPLLAVIGTIATFSTLIRAEILGLFVAALVLVFIPSANRAWQLPRFRALVPLAGGLALASMVLSLLSPVLLGGIVERSLPGILPQSAKAVETAEPRREAVVRAVEIASQEPMGLGLVSEDELLGHNVDAIFTAHSTPAWLLFYAGWLGLVTAVGAWIAIIARSFRERQRGGWLHPAFVASIAMLTCYSFGAAGLVLQPQVIGMAALLTALRFSVPPSLDADAAP